MTSYDAMITLHYAIEYMHDEVPNMRRSVILRIAEILFSVSSSLAAS